MLSVAVRRLTFGLAMGVIIAIGGCVASHQSEDSAREEVRQQEELRKTQVAEEAAANADLIRGEK